MNSEGKTEDVMVCLDIWSKILSTRMFAYLLKSERKAYNPLSFCKTYTMDHQPLHTGEQKDMAELIFFIQLLSKYLLHMIHCLGASVLQLKWTTWASRIYLANKRNGFECEMLISTFSGVRGVRGKHWCKHNHRYCKNALVFYLGFTVHFLEFSIDHRFPLLHILMLNRYRYEKPSYKITDFVWNYFIITQKNMLIFFFLFKQTTASWRHLGG